jgi:hypothetical protein
MVVVHQFWFEVGKGIKTKISLCPLRILSQRSFLLHGNEVHFWSYQPIGNQIKEAVYRDAREIVSEEEFLSRKIIKKKPTRRGEVMKDLHIAHFSDYFRAKLLFMKGGWWFDTDTYCLNRLPFPTKKDKGVILCSLPAKIEGSRAIKRAVHNGCQFSNSTLYAEKGHPLMKKISERVKDSFGKPLFSGFIEPMMLSFDVVKEEGFLDSIRPSIIFIPLCWWRSKFYYHENDSLRKRTSFGAYIPTTKKILRESATINFYNGTFDYLFDEKENAAKTIFKIICERSRMKIDTTQMYFDGNNYHVEEKITRASKKIKL